MKRLLAVALLFACAPAAYAFPPCPNGGQMIPGPARAASSGWAPWTVTYYELVGDPAVIAQITATRTIDSPNGGGQCRPKAALPVRANQPDALARPYIPRTGFGVLTLPDMPSIAQRGLSVRNTLSFTVDNTPMPKGSNWVDFLVMDFKAMDPAHPLYNGAPTTTYRLRKVAAGKTNTAIQVWESRAVTSSESSQGASSYRTEDLVATISMPPPSADTKVSLRWTQQVGAKLNGALQIESRMEVLSATNPVYTATLPGEWASMVSMGLIDYVMTDTNFGKDQDLSFDGQSLRTEVISQPK